MKYGKYHKVKTIRINCDEGEAELNSSHMVSFDKPVTPSYGLFTWELSEAFFRAQIMHNENILKEPYKVSILCDLNFIAKHKPADPETSVDRLEWYVRNMLPSDTPMIFTIYLSKRENYLTPHQRGWLWPLKYQWDPKNVSDYVTVQLPENYVTPPGNQQRKNWEEPLEHFKKTCPYEIKYIGYSDSIDYCYQTLKHTRYHFSYLGATYYLASMMRVPSIIMGYEQQDRIAMDWDNDKKIIVDHSEWILDRVIQLRDLTKKNIKMAHVDTFRMLKNTEHLTELMEEYDAFTD